MLAPTKDVCLFRGGSVLVPCWFHPGSVVNFCVRAVKIPCASSIQVQCWFPCVFLGVP